jgi:hypothetical protein
VDHVRIAFLGAQNNIFNYSEKLLAKTENEVISEMLETQLEVFAAFRQVWG